MTAVLIGLAGIVVGALLQAVTGWIGDSRAARQEHQHWLREKRYEAFLALPVAMRDLLDALKRNDPIRVRDALTQFEHRRFQALMLADDMTRAVMQQELLKFVVTWEGEEKEAREAVLRMEMALSPYLTNHKTQRDTGYDGRSMVENILKWDDAQRAKVAPQRSDGFADTGSAAQASETRE